MTKKMNYNDLKDQELFVEASAIRFYMRQEGWVNRGEVVSYRDTYVQDRDQAPATQEQNVQYASRQRSWIEWPKFA
ncbi:hypothetical protein [Pontibacter anaerobius]|uniref:Uncharacterized protein n=1 Tax=Pontibacter anaerobius TaxID=2993940 RepID=A0ABT3RHY0_9BACT|nr:hypothetical protein [Pontibacter anaerobius]MCX2741108.1 hypothetical protein [Pontibacter anaerobius]